jgi:hypothetical protein
MTEPTITDLKVQAYRYAALARALAARVKRQARDGLEEGIASAANSYADLAAEAARTGGVDEARQMCFATAREEIRMMIRKEKTA